jgi:hypothetical protein
MHYVTRRSHRMKKHKFGVTCPHTLFMENTPCPPEHEKQCVDISRHGHTGMHYMTRRSHQMQKHKFGVMSPSTLFVESISAHPSMKNSAITFNASDVPECIM